MNKYIYELNAKRLHTKATLLSFKNSTISFAHIDLINEEHRTPFLLFCIESPKELSQENLQNKIDIINGILLILSHNIGIHTNIKLGRRKEIITVNKGLKQSISEGTNLLSEIYSIVIKSVELEEIFMYLGTDISFSGLYKITDILKQLGIKESTEIKKFKHTANTSSIGAESRHGLNPNESPANPMSLDEGFIIICKAIGEEFKNKHSITIPLIQKGWGDLNF